MRATLRKMGNSAGIVLPKPVLAQVGARHETQFDLSVENGRIILMPVRRPREGWAEASKALAASGDDGVDDDWLAVSNAFDDAEWDW